MANNKYDHRNQWNLDKNAKKNQYIEDISLKEYIKQIRSQPNTPSEREKTHSDAIRNKIMRGHECSLAIQDLSSVYKGLGSILSITKLINLSFNQKIKLKGELASEIVEIQIIASALKNCI